MTKLRVLMNPLPDLDALVMGQDNGPAVEAREPNRPRAARASGGWATGGRVNRLDASQMLSFEVTVDPALIERNREYIVNSTINTREMTRSFEQLREAIRGHRLNARIDNSEVVAMTDEVMNGGRPFVEIDGENHSVRMSQSGPQNVLGRVAGIRQQDGVVYAEVDVNHNVSERVVGQAERLIRYEIAQNMERQMAMRVDELTRGRSMF